MASKAFGKLEEKTLQLSKKTLYMIYRTRFKNDVALGKSGVYRMTGENDNFGRRTEDLQERNTVTWKSGGMSLWLSKQEMTDYI